MPTTIPKWVKDEYPERLTISQTADLMTKLGFKIAVETLRTRRKKWLKGEKWGPTPLLVSVRRLEYERDNVVEVVEGLFADAHRRAAEAGTGANE